MRSLRIGLSRPLTVVGEESPLTRFASRVLERLAGFRRPHGGEVPLEREKLQALPGELATRAVSSSTDKEDVFSVADALVAAGEILILELTDQDIAQALD